MLMVGVINQDDYAQVNLRCKSFTASVGSLDISHNIIVWKLKSIRSKKSLIVCRMIKMFRPHLKFEDENGSRSKKRGNNNNGFIIVFPIRKGNHNVSQILRKGISHSIMSDSRNYDDNSLVLNSLIYATSV